MITANELRIGNYVWDVELKRYARICNINHDGCVRVFAEDTSSVHVINLHPIPLTKEILLKCGFVPNGTLRDRYYVDVNDKDWVDVRFTRNYVYIKGTMIRSMKIKHLHQLQNLVHALTGEELNVQL